MDTPTALDLAAADRFRPDHELVTGEGDRYGIVEDGLGLYVWEAGEWLAVGEEDVPESVVSYLEEIAS